MAYLLPCLACNQIVSLPQDLALVRFFPQCNHLFHIACLPGQVPINQSTCPNCRGRYVPPLSECKPDDILKLNDRNWRIGLTVGGAAIGALLAPVVAPPLLGIVGFSAAGPVAGQGLLNTDQGGILNLIHDRYNSCCYTELNRKCCRGLGVCGLPECSDGRCTSRPGLCCRCCGRCRRRRQNH